MSARIYTSKNQRYQLSLTLWSADCRSEKRLCAEWDQYFPVECTSASWRCRTAATGRNTCQDLSSRWGLSSWTSERCDRFSDTAYSHGNDHRRSPPDFINPFCLYDNRRNLHKTIRFCRTDFPKFQTFLSWIFGWWYLTGNRTGHHASAQPLLRTGSSAEFWNDCFWKSRPLCCPFSADAESLRSSYAERWYLCTGLLPPTGFWNKYRKFISRHTAVFPFYSTKKRTVCNPLSFCSLSGKSMAVFR